MTSSILDPIAAMALRQRAVSRLQGHAILPDAQHSGAAALNVLHSLAQAPATAPDALALLHELQVHQVELDLQAEELRNSRAELEAALARQTQLYESAPVACFTLDAKGALRELNQSAVALLGVERYALLGQPLVRFLMPHSAAVLVGELQKVSAGRRAGVYGLQISARNGEAPAVYASVNADPAGEGFLVCFMPAGEAPVPPTPGV